MAGVPSSKGCDTCRKQKKKCKPTPNGPCERCARLHTHCSGGGKQRYKFINESVDSRSTTAVCNQTALSRSKSSTPPTPQLMSNDQTRFVARLVSCADPTVDISVSLMWNFVPFLREIPCRVGSNEALDACSDCLITSYSYVRQPEPGLALQMYKKEAYAFKSLQRCLNDASTVHSTETLCAVYLLMTQQNLTGNHDPPATHARAAAEMLRARGYSEPKSELERQLRIALRGPIVYEALVGTMDMSFSQEEWDIIVESTLLDANGTLTTETIRQLARLPYLRDRVEEAITSDSTSPALLQDVQQAFEHFMVLNDEARARLTPDYTSLAEEPADSPVPLQTLHATRVRQLGYSLAMCIATGLLLEAFDTGGYARALVSGVSSEVLKLAPLAARHRPFGGMHTTMYLSFAWLGASTAAERELLVAWSKVFESDWKGTHETMEKRRQMLRRRFLLGRPAEAIWFPEV